MGVRSYSSTSGHILAWLTVMFWGHRALSQWTGCRGGILVPPHSAELHVARVPAVLLPWTRAAWAPLLQPAASLAVSHMQKCQGWVGWKRKNSDKAAAFPWAPEMAWGINCALMSASQLRSPPAGSEVRLWLLIALQEAEEISLSSPGWQRGVTDNSTVSSQRPCCPFVWAQRWIDH